MEFTEPDMNRFLLIFSAALLLSAASSYAAPGLTRVDADSEYVRLIGRSKADGNGNICFDWSGTTVRVRFSGTSLKLDMSSSRRSYFNMWLDREAAADNDAVLKVVSDTTLVLAEGLKKGEHEVILQLRSEGEQGMATLKSFATDGRFLAPRPAKARHIEFIGDSYTCGYGTESLSRDEPFSIETENCNLTYAAYLSRYFDAEFNLVSHSGMGIVRNYNGKKCDTMTQRYGRVFDEAGKEAWDFSGRRPDLVVIYLGTNDFSVSLQPSLRSWCSEYSKLLGQIRSAYGDGVPVLCVASKADELLGYYVKTAVERSGFPNVHWVAVGEDLHNSDSELGASWHPNAEGQRKLAYTLLPYVSTLSSWAIDPDKSLR